MTKPSAFSLGQRVALARADKGLSQADLASKSGVSQAQISLIEGDERLNPGVLTVDKIARALGVPVNELIPPPPSDRRPRRKAV